MSELTATVAPSAAFLEVLREARAALLNPSLTAAEAEVVVRRIEGALAIPGALQRVAK